MQESNEIEATIQCVQEKMQQQIEAARKQWPPAAIVTVFVLGAVFVLEHAAFLDDVVKWAFALVPLAFVVWVIIYRACGPGYEGRWYARWRRKENEQASQRILSKLEH